MAKKNKKSGGNSATKQAPKNKNLPLILAAAVLVCAAAGTVLFRNSGSGSERSPINTQEIAAGEFLTIQTSEIGDTAAFFPIKVDGTEMEVLAVRASDGTVRTAFNTCQSCFASGRGYYVQEGNDLVCQNCGFHFIPDQVEIQSGDGSPAGGCNPWPIFDTDKTVTEDEIQISYDFLKESSTIFAYWKV